MKKLLLLLLFVPLVSFGQTKDEIQLCIAFQSRSFSSDTEADNALGKILSVTGLKKNFTLTACDGINNALAVSLKGERYIMYDKNLMKNIGGSSSNLAILAHEVGHHLNNHARDITMYIGGVIEPDSKEVSRRQELEADEFAGFVMAKLGYSLNEAKEPFYKLSSNNDDSYSTHPSRDKRLKAITEGYERAGGSSSKSETYANNKRESFEEDLYEDIEYPDVARDDDKAANYVTLAIEESEAKNFTLSASLLEKAFLLQTDRRTALDFLYYASQNYINGESYSKALKPLIYLGQKGYTGITDGSPSKFPEILKNIVLIYAKLGENTKALEWSNYAIKSNPKDINLIQTMAEIYMELGDSESARGFYEKAIELDPSYGTAYFNLTSLILSDESAIVEEMNSLGTSAADNARYDFLKEKRKGIYRECVPLLKKLIRITNNQEAIQTLNNIYKTLGN